MKVTPLWFGLGLFVPMAISQATGPELLAPDSVSPIPLVSGGLRNDDVTTISRNNWIALGRFRSNGEWLYNHDQGKPPELGLALSGGGTRSAMFSLGVLQALSRHQVLDKLDIASSVSGGGYALSWYYWQMIGPDRPFSSEELFHGSKYQQYLEHHGELVGYVRAEDTWLRRAQYGIIGLPATAAGAGVNLFENGIFGWHTNVVPVRRFYEDGIDRVWHVTPADSGMQSKLDLEHVDLSTTNLAPHYRFPAFQRSISEQRASAAKTKLPLCIFNATARWDDSNNDDDSDLRNRVFEFTPIDYGCDATGYRNDYPIDVNRAVSVSGAAVDEWAFIRSASGQIIGSAVDIDLGYFIRNPLPDPKWRWLRKALPFPLFAFDGHHQKDRNGDELYLADGAFADNLAVFSLARRLCHTIVVVDAGYDENYCFADYERLKKAIRKQMSVVLSVREIDARLAECKCRGITERSKLSRSEKRWGSPVMAGMIKDFPLPGRPENDWSLQVVYIKLSLDDDVIRNAPADFSDEANQISLYARMDRSFPQNSTIDQSFTVPQVKAYRALGDLVVEENWERLIRPQMPRER